MISPSRVTYHAPQGTHSDTQASRRRGQQLSYLAAVWSLDRARPMVDGAIYRTRRFETLPEARVWIWTQCFIGDATGRRVEGEVVPVPECRQHRRRETRNGSPLPAEEPAQPERAGPPPRGRPRSETRIEVLGY